MWPRGDPLHEQPPIGFKQPAWATLLLVLVGSPRNRRQGARDEDQEVPRTWHSCSPRRSTRVRSGIVCRRGACCAAPGSPGSSPGLSRRGTGCHYLIHNVLPHEEPIWDRAPARLALRQGRGLIVHSQGERDRPCASCRGRWSGWSLTSLIPCLATRSATPTRRAPPWDCPRAIGYFSSFGSCAYTKLWACPSRPWPPKAPRKGDPPEGGQRILGKPRPLSPDHLAARDRPAGSSARRLCSERAGWPVLHGRGRARRAPPFHYPKRRGCIALGFALPVIATTAQGIPEWARRGVEVRLVPPDSRDELAMAMDHLAEAGFHRYEHGAERATQAWKEKCTPP